MIVNGFCKEVFRELPMEFAVEAQKLLGVSPGRERRVIVAGRVTSSGMAELGAIKDNRMLQVANLHVEAEARRSCTAST